MNINSSSISFGSKIKIVDYKTFHKLPLEQLDSKGKYLNCCSNLTADDIIKADEAFTDGLCCCSGGGITDGKKITMFHLIPENKNVKGYIRFKKIRDVLEQKTGIKDKACSDFNGLLIGGRSEEVRKKSPKHNQEANCIKLFNKLKGFYTKNNIPHSTIWGHKKGDIMTETYYSALKDTWFIRPLLKINSVQDFKNTYELIKFSEKDKKDGIWINGKKFTDEEVAQLEQGG